MGIYIKGMEMPVAGCASCQFCSEPIYDCRGFATYVCGIDISSIKGTSVTKEVLNAYEGSKDKQFPKWCPLVEVPQHGRLIDADALKEKWLAAENRMGADKVFHLPLKDYISDGCVYDLEQMPTIIEAEDGE